MKEVSANVSHNIIAAIFGHGAEFADIVQIKGDLRKNYYDDDIEQNRRGRKFKNTQNTRTLQ